jgi:hypothetical protein
MIFLTAKAQKLHKVIFICGIQKKLFTLYSKEFQNKECMNVKLTNTKHCYLSYLFIAENKLRLFSMLKIHQLSFVSKQILI